MKKIIIHIVLPIILSALLIWLLYIIVDNHRADIRDFLYGEDYYGEDYYETNSLDDYLYLPHNDGFLTGGYWMQKDPIEYVKMMFPPKIEPYFSNVEYHLKASGCLEIVLEATLEFTIEDPEQFQSYVSSLLGDRETTPFPFDNEWAEYVQGDKYSVYDHFYTDDPNITEWDVSSCYIGKVLINYNEQRFFFVVIDETESGFYSYEFTDYFSRFNIDIGEYAKYTEQNDWLDAREKRRRALFKTGDGSLS